MILGVLQGRMSSRRLPGKILEPVAGEPMLIRQIERVRRCRRLDALVVATSDDPSDDPVADLARKRGIEVYRGALEDVLDRVYRAARPCDPRHIVRLTLDCPLADPEIIDACVDLHLASGCDYTSNVHPPSWPDGLDVEVLTARALASAWAEARDPFEREHVTSFVYRRPDRFSLRNLEKNGTDLSHLRWTVDEPADLSFVRAVYDALYPVDPAFGTANILDLLNARPEIAKHNHAVPRDAGSR